MRRMLLVLAVAALMVAMMATALPALADKGGIRGHHTFESSH